MKATLSFDLPEEREEFKLAQNGPEYSIVISDLDNWLRNKLKHETLSRDAEEAYSWTRKHLLELAADRGIEI